MHREPYNSDTMPKLLLFVAAVLLVQAGLSQTPQPVHQPYQNIPAVSSLLRAELDRRPAAPATRAAAEARQAEVRATMLRLLGPLPARTPLNPVVLGETALPGMRIQKILLDSQPGFHVTALLYLPDATLVSGALPAIVMAPGHSPAGKAGDFAFASAFARNGFAVLSYDPLGQGERLQYPDPRDPTHTLAKGPTGEHGEASLQPMLLGESVAKYFLWDGIRAVDYLQTRPEIDPKRIGAFGCSGGGAMTAILGALEPRLAAVATACYLTSWDALLHSVGPQDGEQSTPGWIAAGLGFPDYVEAVAPRPYAIIATEDDMFPFAGAVATEKESRQFFKAFDADQQLAFITGPGGHGNLRPILPRILRFFIDALHPALNARIYDDQSPSMKPPAGALQVTPTGQVSTFDIHAETVYSLNLKHAASVSQPHPENLAATQDAVRALLLPQLPGHSGHLPGRGPARASRPSPDETLPWASRSFVVDGPADLLGAAQPGPFHAHLLIHRPDGTSLAAELLLPRMPDLPTLDLLLATPDQPSPERLAELARTNHLVLIVSPTPDSPGNAETKAPQLGPWYLPGLSAELVGTSLLGLRVEDTLLALDYLNSLRLPHKPGITAEASGHLALVLLHAAVLETSPKPNEPQSVTRVVLHALPPTYTQLLATPLPVDAAQDILPGVLLHYDVPDLIATLGRRVAVVP